MALVRALLAGYPKQGKTGSIACLANAGYKVRFWDFDDNMISYLANLTAAGKENTRIVKLLDKLQGNETELGVKGTPKAFTRALQLVERYRVPKVGPDGLPIPLPKEEGKVQAFEMEDLGSVASWGKDTIAVVDGMSGLGRAALRRTMFLQGRGMGDAQDRDIGSAMREQETFLELMKEACGGCHWLMVTHLKIHGPKDKRKGDSDIATQIKEDTAEFIRTRLVPSALGWVLPPLISQHFSTSLMYETNGVGDKSVRQIMTRPRPEFDVACPIKEMPATLPIADGLLTYFTAHEKL